MYHHNLKPSFRLVVSALLDFSVNKALRRPGVCLFLLLLILICGFPVRAQRNTQSIIFADDFESDPSSGPGGLLNGPGDIRNTNPRLGPLQNNGGPTMTHALLVNSPAINAGDPNFNPYAFTPPLLYDQRNSRRFPRGVNGRIDIGAFESKSP